MDTCRAINERSDVHSQEHKKWPRAFHRSSPRLAPSRYHVSLARFFERFDPFFPPAPFFALDAWCTTPSWSFGPRLSSPPLCVIPRAPAAALRRAARANEALQRIGERHAAAVARHAAQRARLREEAAAREARLA